MGSRSRFSGAVKPLFLALFAGILWAGCADDGLVSPGSQPDSDLNLFDLAPDVQVQELAPSMLVLRRNTTRLMRDPSVVATAVGLTERGRPAIQMYVTGLVLDEIPEELNGIPVIVIETGPIVALQQAQDRGELDPRKRCASPPCKKPDSEDPPPEDGGTVSPTDKNRPAPMGVSIGHPNITAGTLGAYVTDGATTFILSNNHVLADENAGPLSVSVLQPGPFDGGKPADQIATLTHYVQIVFSRTASNVIDAAIAAVDNPDDVDASTRPVGYGVPGSQPVLATVGMRVMKVGRTTGFTKGRVRGIAATVNVGYDTGVARFVGQIIIGGGGFSAGGDSGSLIVVQDGEVNAREPVGLLFAGGGGVTIANPIAEVLTGFEGLNLTIVGN